MIPYDIVLHLRKLEDSLPRREQQVAKFLLANMEFAVHLTLTEIADRVGVSVATVNRFCRSLGCDGFKQFKILFAQNVAVSLQYLRSSSTTASSTEQMVGNVFNAISNAIAKAQNQLNYKTLERAIHTLAASKRLAFLGVGGGSASIATEGANRFFRLGILAEVQHDGYMQRMLASTYGLGDTVVAISSTGEPQELLDSIRISHQYGASTIGITPPDSPLAKACDIAITLDCPEDADIYMPTASRFAFLATLDVLATGVAKANPDSTRETLRRMRASIVTIQGSIRSRPIGD